MKKLYLHHTVIPPWIYRIPSELRSQAGLGLPSTVVGDHTGIVSAVCYNFFIIHIIIVIDSLKPIFVFLPCEAAAHEGSN